MLAVAVCSATAQPAPVPYRWLPVRILGGGYVPGIIFHPKQKGLAYARTDIGGAYRWDDSAQRWTPLTDWIRFAEKNDFGVESLAIDPNDPSRLYLAVGGATQSWAPDGAILRSLDQGRKFDRIALPFKLGANEEGRGAGERLHVDPANGKVLYLGSRHDGLWRSLDGASTWKKIDTFPALADDGIGIVATLPMGGADVASLPGADAFSSKSIFVVASVKSGGLLHSGDGGATWQRVPKQPTNLVITNTALAANGELYLSYGNTPGPMGETAGAIWKLDTVSGKWSDLTPAIPGFKWPDGTTSPLFGYGGITVSATHPEVLLASTLDRWHTGDGIYRSTDGGKHWVDIATGEQPRFMGPSPWLHHDQPLKGAGGWPTALAIDPFDENHVLFTTGETVWETKEANALQQGHPVRWTLGSNGIEESAVLTLISPPTGPHLISGLRDIGGLRHDDLNISPRAGAFKNPELNDTSSIAYASKNPLLMVRVGGSFTGTVFGASSRDQGVTWTAFATQPQGTKGSGTVAITADGKSVVWAGTGAPVSVSEDMGAKWTPLAETPKNARLAADPVNAGKVYLYEPEEGAVLLSVDAGHSFKAYAQGLPKALPYQQPTITAVPDREGDLWISSDAGLFHSSDPDKPFVKIATIDKVHASGIGKAAGPNFYPTIFAFGQIHDVTGLYGSTDDAKTWLQLDDAAHRFGSITTVVGDPRIFGRVYAGTEGRGIFYGDPLGSPQTRDSQPQ
jgi:photosystem II stability/assembly factor-like uncharacterized protein